MCFHYLIVKSIKSIYFYLSFAQNFLRDRKQSILEDLTVKETSCLAFEENHLLSWFLSQIHQQGSKIFLLHHGLQQISVVKWRKSSLIKREEFTVEFSQK